jgi:hypothetical protein
MATRFQQPQQSRQKELQRTRFASDDDLFLPVSIYLSSSEERQEIVDSVVGVLRAYGFSRIPGVYQAPGSFFIYIRAGFESNNREAARQRQQELKADLLKKKAPKTPRRQQAVSKLNQSLSERAKKKLGAIVIAGAVFLGTAVTDVIKDEIETLIKEQAPKVVRKMDAVVGQELPPELAAKFHRAVSGYIEKSPAKEELPVPEE